MEKVQGTCLGLEAEQNEEKHYSEAQASSG